MEMQNMDIEEYKTLRTEILQYLQNYQNIRNMMYGVSLTMLGFFINNEVDALFFLSPSIIIIPSYFAAINYWQCTTKISTYINVFFERENMHFNWETRNFEFGKQNKNITKMDTQLMPYIVMQFFCVILYFINIDYNSDNKYKYVFLGLLFILLSFYIFNKYKKDRGDDYIDLWERIKKNDINSNQTNDKLL